MSLVPAGIRGISFDATHTLIEPVPPATIYAEVLRRHGREVDEAALDPLLREVWQELGCSVQLGADRFATHPGGAVGFWRRYLERLLERLGIGPLPPFAAAELYTRFAEPSAWRVFPEVAEVLVALRRHGFGLAITSNWDERLPELLSRLGLAAAVDAIVVSQAVGVEKPHPGIFRETARRLGLEPAAILHVGDAPLEDVEGATAAGFEALLLDRGGSRGDLVDLLPLATGSAGRVPRRLVLCGSLPREGR